MTSCCSTGDDCSACKVGVRLGSSQACFAGVVFARIKVEDL